MSLYSKAAGYLGVLVLMYILRSLFSTPHLPEDATLIVEESVEDLEPDFKQEEASPSVSTPPFKSPSCLKHRNLPSGKRVEGSVGQGGHRARCYSMNSELPGWERSKEYLSEIKGSVDVSLEHKVIYIPVMKAGTQMFQQVFRKRLKGKRVNDEDLAAYIGGEHNLKDFFVFTFVRDPFSMFRSGYGEMSMYAARKVSLFLGIHIL